MPASSAIPVRRYKLVAFVLSVVVTAIGGALFTFLKVFASADPVHPNFSGEILAMSIIGGAGHFLGPPIGAAFYLVFREVLSAYTAAWLFWFGLLFMAFILFSPSGLVGLGERLAAPFRRQREELASMAARVKPNPAQEVPAYLVPATPPGAGGVLLEADRVSKSFDDFTAVNRVSLQLHHGRLQALIGPNGAGKTTLFNLLSGLFPPDAGTLRIGAAAIDDPTPERMVTLGVARSFQITNLFQGLTLFENLRLGVQARHPQRFNLWLAKEALEDVNQETQALIKFLGLEGVEQAPVSSLSYGGQRLLEIGLALAARPKLLLLDEPLAGLAAGERERIVAMIRVLSRHMGVLLIEHDIDRVFEFADSITVMADGAVLAEGSADEVQANTAGAGGVPRQRPRGRRGARLACAPRRGAAAAAYARRRQHLLRQEPHPLRRKPRGARRRSHCAARPEWCGEVFDRQDHHGPRAAGERHGALRG